MDSQRKQAVTGTAAVGLAEAPAGVLPAGAATSDAALRQLLHGLPGVDQVGATARAAALATRSIKRDAKMWALDAAIRMMDLTTLEGADTPGKVRGLCAKARRPDPRDAAVPPVAAVCVYPDLVALARGELDGSGVAVASVATAFPSGRASLAVKLADVADAVAAGADEVDMVIDRGAFLAGRYGQVSDEIRAVREACGPGPPQGDPGDRGTGHPGQCGPRLLAGHAVRCRLHQDVDREGQPGRHPAGRPGHAGCRGGLRRRHRAPRRRESGRRRAHRQGRDPLSGAGPGDRPPGPGSPRRTSGSARPACSTTCSCSAPSSSPAATRARTTSPWTEDHAGQDPWVPSARAQTVRRQGAGPDLPHRVAGHAAAMSTPGNEMP